MRKKVLIAAAVIVLAGAGLGAAYAVLVSDRPEGRLDTALSGVSVVTFAGTSETETVPETTPPAATTAPAATTTEAEPAEGPCWEEFGGSPQRTLSRATIDLGVPRSKPVWARGVGSLMEFQPSFCDGTLYVNTAKGLTLAFDADTGEKLWQHQGHLHASTPAIGGSRLFVSSNDGTVTALDRHNGKLLWQLRTSSSVESSPVVIDTTVYFAATDGRLFAVNAVTGAVRWAYDTGSKVTASPTIWGNLVCIDTYAGGVFCLDRESGKKVWDTYVKRNAFTYESFYASLSTDGKRLYGIGRSGSVVALSLHTGQLIWRQSVGSWGYPTPAVAGGRVFVGGFDGALRAFRASNGRLLWSTNVGGYIIGPALVVGNLVFVSSPPKSATFGIRVADGKIVWHYPAGRFSPGIATTKRYYFSLNGLLAAFEGRGR